MSDDKKTVTLKMDSVLYDALQERAKRMGTTVSELLRQAAERDLTHKPSLPDTETAPVDLPPVVPSRIVESGPDGLDEWAERRRSPRLVLPIADTIGTTGGWTARPWYIPEKLLPVLRKYTDRWPGVRLVVSEPLPEDSGKSPNRRLEPALKGDCKVWFEVEDAVALLEYLKDGNTDTPVAIVVDSLRYETDEVYREACDLYHDYLIYYFEEGSPYRPEEIREEDLAERFMT